MGGSLTRDTTGTRAQTLDPRRIERVLIVRMSALGDVVHVLPCLAALRRLLPRASIDWVVEPLGAMLLEGHPQLNDIHVIHRKRWARDFRRPGRWLATWRDVRALARELRERRYDLAIDFQGNARSALVARMSGARWRLGFARPDCREWLAASWANVSAPPAPVGVNKVAKNLHLLGVLGWEGEPPEAVLPIAEADRRWARDVLAARPGAGPAVTMHPAVSAFGAFKQWPPEYFARLCGLLRERLDARVTVTWGPGEEALARRVGGDLAAPPTERLLRLAALAAESDLFVACDTGSLHIAAALGTPIIGLYGPKNPQVYGPWRYRGALLRSGVPCSPCDLRRCEHAMCMSELYPETVFTAARHILAASARRRVTVGAGATSPTTEQSAAGDAQSE